MTTRRTLLTGALGAGLTAPFAGAAFAQSTGDIAFAAQFSEAASYSAARGGVSFLVMRTGVVLTEDYPNGGGLGVAHNLFSGTKPFASVLAGLLVRQRLSSTEIVRTRRGKRVRRVTSRPMMTLDEPAALTLGGWGGDPRKSRVTIRQLLTMTSGVAIGLTPGSAPDTQAALDAPAVDEPGARFIYDNAPAQIFAEIARRKLVAAGLATDPAAFLQSAILDDIGCTPIRFRRGGDGLAWLATGAETTARGWAAFGEFVRRRGLWRGRYLASETAMTEMGFGSSASMGRFGMGWWTANASPGAAPDMAGRVSDLWEGRGVAPEDTLMAAGVGGQRLFVIPSRRLVIVRQARAPADPAAAAAGGDWSDLAFLSMVLRAA
jgi:CubicO group peptidase (beta-lactamase class C family)